MIASDIYEGTQEWKTFLAQESAQARQEIASKLKKQSNPISLAEASSHRDRGNELFGIKKYEQSIDEYIQCLMHVPSDNEIYAICLANIAACHIQMEKISPATLELLRISLNSGLYPQDRIQKLMDRIEFVKKSMRKVNSTPQISSQLSSDVEIASDSFGGRQIVARCDLSHGDTALASEIPYAAILFREYEASRCHHCFRPARFRAPMACFACRRALYCSTDCLKTAQIQYHAIECHHLNLLAMAPVALQLAVRIAIRGSRGDIAQYDQIQTLLDHKESFSKERTESLQRDISCLLDLVPISIGFDAILKHYMQVQTNSYAVSDLVSSTSPSGIISQQQLRVGCALYPLGSLFNHSCSPNAIASFLDSSNILTVKISKRCRSHEPICHSYGVDVWRNPRKEDRIKALQEKYFFNCTCESCCGDPKDEANFSAAEADRDLLRNADQLEAAGRDMMRQNSNRAITKESAPLLRKICSLFDEAAKSLLNVSSPLNDLLLRAAKLHDKAANILSSATLFHEASQYLSISIETIRKVFGAESAELGREYFKLASIRAADINQMIEDSMNYRLNEEQRTKLRDRLNKLDSAITSASNLLRPVLSTSDPDYKELMELKSFAESTRRQFL